MKPVIGAILWAAILWAATGGADAALEAQFVTSRGTITAELDHVRAPKAIANLLTLATGSRSWTDSRTGAVRTEAFYDGLDFHQVTDTGTVKLIGTGSRTGNGTDDPGFTFPDELDPALTHQPYVLAMANSGPNTNGSRIYFTGNVALPARDGLHTVFGTVPGAASRAVIDAILAAGPGNTTISGVQVLRNEVPASVFDELAVSLPGVTALAPALQVSPATQALLTQPAGTTLLAHRSTDLAVWSPHYQHYLGPAEAPGGPSLIIDDAASPAAFFRFSLTTSPNSLGPSQFANRTLTTASPLDAGTLVYTFDATGGSGTYQNIINDPMLGDIVFYEGSFEVRDEIPARFGPYSFEMLLFLFDEELGGSPFNHIRGGYDTATPAELTGRYLTSFLDADMAPVFDHHGAMQLSRP